MEPLYQNLTSAFGTRNFPVLGIKMYSWLDKTPESFWAEYGSKETRKDFMKYVRNIIKEKNSVKKYLCKLYFLPSFSWIFFFNISIASMI